MKELYRKNLVYEKAKGYVLFRDRRGNYTDRQIYHKENEQEMLELYKQYALKNDLDILHCPHTIASNSVEYREYYKYGNSQNINEDNIYEMNRVFLDIDSYLWENYRSLRKVIKSLGCKVDVFESTRGRIHLYIHIKKTTKKGMYRKLVGRLVGYFRQFNLNVDTGSISPMQLTYLEGFRVLAKGGNSSRHIKEFSKGGGVCTAFELLKRITKADFKTTEAMDILYDELHRRGIDETTRGSDRLNLSEISRRYSIPTYTFTRALQVLEANRAVFYKTILGCKGGIRVQKVDYRRWRKARRVQLTRKSNYYFINMLASFSWCKGIIKTISECCIYTRRGILEGIELQDIPCCTGYTQGLLSGSSGSLGSKSSKIGATEVIEIGNRNATLVKRLIKARYRGLDLDRVLSDVMSKMVQTAVEPFTYQEGQAVLKWVRKIDLRGQ